jgi:hypothetical protein
MTRAPSALAGIRVLDLTRALAMLLGPSRGRYFLMMVATCARVRVRACNDLCLSRYYMRSEVDIHVNSVGASRLILGINDKKQIRRLGE